MGPHLWHNRMFRQSATYGTKYRVRQIVHKTTRTDINSRTLQAAVILKLDFRNLKSTRNKKTISFWNIKPAFVWIIQKYHHNIMTYHHNYIMNYHHNIMNYGIIKTLWTIFITIWTIIITLQNTIITLWIIIITLWTFIIT